jgi:hypothetical protein
MLKNSFSVLNFLVISLLISVFSVSVNAVQWPQAIETDGVTVTVYQPQPEELNGKTLSGRAAMSIKLANQAEPTWGVFWFEADIETDRSEDTATISNIKVIEVRWPDSEDADEKRFTAFVEKEIVESVFTTSITQLKATLAASDEAQQSLDNLKHDAPDIIFSNELAVLLSYDGKPKFQAIKDSKYLRAVNTPLAVAANEKETEFYLTSGSIWYQASNPTGPWQVTENVPTDLSKLIKEDDSEKQTRTPKIIAATEATELISTDGDAQWKSLVGGKLMYVENTETPWLRDIANGNMYVLLSGRWFESKTQAGPWSFVRPDRLPKSFSEIPPESDLGGLRSSIAGTDEANEAVMDTQIPQTAAVKRNGTSVTISYDGEPKFEAISGTEIAYAVNTSSQVLMINKKYYAVEDAIWYASNSATGPWVVADEVPANEIAKIPPSSPAYNTTFVNIYGSTTEVVYVGYTPGYYWSYPYYGVPVYGTGYYYRPYYSPFYYYPYPRTWGMHVGYGPGGWSYGVSWGGPFLSVGIGFGGSYNHGYYGGYHNHNNIVINNNNNINIGNSVNIDRGRVNNIRNDRNNNIYKNSRVKDKISASPRINNKDFKSSKGVDRANNVLADRNGNVVRKDNDKWQSMNQGKWQDLKNQNASRDQIQNRSTNPSRQSDITRNMINNQNSSRENMRNRTGAVNPGNFNRNSMNRQYNARSRGNFGASGMHRRR